MRQKKGAFGVVYQDVMRNPTIPVESKAIYAYLSSMAGADGRCYPSRELMAKELGIGVHRLDKFLILLVKSGAVEKTRINVGNLKNRNVYKITHELEVKKELEDIFNCDDTAYFRHIENGNIENGHIENRHDGNIQDDNKQVEFSLIDSEHCNNNSINNNSINNNSINNNSIKNNYCASVPDATKPEPEAVENMTPPAEKKKASAPNRKEANELFERLWSLYPSKKGKGQVSDRKKAELLKVGYDEMNRAIKRYKEGLEKDADWRKPQNGSTFFNSGYIDYLDKNYTGAEDDGMDGSEQRREEMERYADLIPDFPEDADLPFG